MIRVAIYCITNTVTGKVYVGSSRNAPKRLYRHGWMLRGGRHDNAQMQKAWDRDGPDAFKFEIIEAIDDVATILEREQFWIAKLKAASHQHGYNACPVAGSREGAKQPLGFAAMISAFHKGKTKSAETRAKMSAGSLGRKKSQEHRNNIRAATIRQMADPERRARAAEYGRMATPHMTGKKHSPETIAKQKAAHALRPRGPTGHYLKKP